MASRCMASRDGGETRTDVSDSLARPSPHRRTSALAGLVRDTAPRFTGEEHDQAARVKRATRNPSMPPSS